MDEINLDIQSENQRWLFIESLLGILRNMNIANVHERNKHIFLLGCLVDGKSEIDILTTPKWSFANEAYRWIIEQAKAWHTT